MANSRDETNSDTPEDDAMQSPNGAETAEASTAQDDGDVAKVTDDNSLAAENA